MTKAYLSNVPRNLRKKTQKDLFALNLRFGLVRALKGLDYYRVIEYSLTFILLSLRKGDRILDLGSSDSIFPIYLAAKGCETFTIDINRKVGELRKLAKIPLCK